MPNVSEKNSNAIPTGNQLWYLENAIKQGKLPDTSIIVTIKTNEGTKDLTRFIAGELIGKLKNGDNDA